METKGAKEKHLNAQLEYLRRKPLLDKASSELDTDWVEKVLNKETVDPNTLPLKDKHALPTQRQVLLLFHFFRNIDKTSKKSVIAERVRQEIDKYWLHSNIPTQTIWWVIKGMLSLNEKYEQILKNINRDSETETKKRSNFVSGLDQLFDIASPQAEKELRKDQVLGSKKAKEDLLFLESQRTDRVAKMSNHDKDYDKQVMKVNARKAKQEVYKASSSKEMESQFKIVVFEDKDDDGISEQKENNNDSEFDSDTKTHKKRRSDTVTVEIPRKLFSSTEIVSMLDRTQVSSRKAVGITAAILKAGGADLTDFTISHRQVHRQRDQSRGVLAVEAVSLFQANKPDFSVLHWDSKLIDDAHGTQHERLAVLVSGAPNYIEGKLLGVPSLVDEDGNTTSTGLAQFEGARDLVKTWNLENSVRGLVFDTTASNSGVKQGACKRMEDWLERPVLWLACRHHVAELIAKASWYELFEEDLGPDNGFFVQFKNDWPNLNTGADFPTKKLDIRGRHLVDLTEEAIEFYTSILSNKNSRNVLPRDDYRTLAETSLVILGGQLPAGRNLFWHKPGATHKARFMAFGIYANMKYSFINQLDYDKEMEAALRRFVQFFNLIYIPYFLKASFGADSPVTDLDMHHKLYKYRKVDAVLADKALAVLARHGWYLVEQVVPFALFSNKVDMDTKSQMAARMLTFSPPRKMTLGKPKFPDVKPATKLIDLVGPNSHMLFNILGVNYDWLGMDPNKWCEDSHYKTVENFVRTVKTVNDCAERSVKMITDYATILTQDEKVRDWLLQGVESNRRKYPDFNVKTLNK